MTDGNTPVEQVDRDAANDWDGIINHRWSEYEGDALHDLAVDFASHRLTTTAALQAERDGLREALSGVADFVEKFRAPWGSWKTAWWEGEVSDDAAFTPDNALMHVHNLSRRGLGRGQALSPSLDLQERGAGKIPSEAKFLRDLTIADIKREGENASVMVRAGLLLAILDALLPTPPVQGEAK